MELTQGELIGSAQKGRMWRQQVLMSCLLGEAIPPSLYLGLACLFLRLFSWHKITICIFKILSASLGFGQGSRMGCGKPHLESHPACQLTPPDRVYPERTGRDCHLVGEVLFPVLGDFPGRRDPKAS